MFLIVIYSFVIPISVIAAALITFFIYRYFAISRLIKVKIPTKNDYQPQELNSVYVLDFDLPKKEKAYFYYKNIKVTQSKIAREFNSNTYSVSKRIFGFSKSKRLSKETHTWDSKGESKILITSLRLLIKTENNVLRIDMGEIANLQVYSKKTLFVSFGTTRLPMQLHFETWKEVKDFANEIYTIQERDKNALQK